MAPIPHRHHDGFLVHFELWGLVELQTPLPGIAETIWPFAGMAVALVPNVLFGPQPTLFPQRQYQLQYVNVPFAVFSFFLDVKHETSSRFEHPQELLAPR